MTSPTPEYLYVQAPADAGDESLLAAVTGAIRRSGGDVLAAAPEREVELLEPGTPAAAIVLGRWQSREDFESAWQSEVSGALAPISAGGALVLAMPGLPVDGLPDDLDVPTVASVRPPRLSTPPTYMAIQGSVTDPIRIQGYRDVILPMMKERDALYTVFCIVPGDVRALHGRWSEQIFAISRWPTHEAAHDFWYSERYQKEAIPIRTGIGSFHVHLAHGQAG